MYLKEESKNIMERLRELTEIVVPFRETINDTNIIDTDGSKKASMRYIYKDDDASIAMIYIEAEFLHKNHFHQEREIIILLQGQAERIFESHIQELIINVPVIIEPMEHHTFYYPKESKLLVITIPASRHFPNFKSNG